MRRPHSLISILFGAVLGGVTVIIVNNQLYVDIKYNRVENEKEIHVHDHDEGGGQEQLFGFQHEHGKLLLKLAAASI